MDRINVLLISTFYPPLNHIASNRIFSFAKYLDKTKYKIFVLTVDNNSEINESIDIEDVTVVRVKNYSPFIEIKPSVYILHNFMVLYNVLCSLFISKYSFWYQKSYKTSVDIVAKNNIGIIISSFGPVEPHKVAIRLKKKFSHLKWIADMRDEMSTSLNINALEKFRLRRTERKIRKYGDALCTVSKPLIEIFKKNIGQKCIYREIMNGFDFDIKDSVVTNNVFTITYTGTFYKDRKPFNFFIALNKLLETGRISSIKVHFVGTYFDFKVPDLVTKFISQSSRVSHHKALEYMSQSDILLLIHPNNGSKGVYTGKLFEYLGMLKPIIALVDKTDVAAELIRNCRAGYVADSENIDEISEVIMQAYNDWMYGRRLDFNISMIKTLHRSNQAKLLEELIDSLS